MARDFWLEHLDWRVRNQEGPDSDEEDPEEEESENPDGEDEE